MATHSSILAWRIPWAEGPGSLYSSWGCKESDMTEQLTHWCTDILARTFEANLTQVLQIAPPLPHPVLYNRCSLAMFCTCVCVCVHAHAQSCLTLCDPVNCYPPGSSVHGISQAWILEQVAISYSRGSSWPRDRTRISWFFTTVPSGKPCCIRSGVYVSILIAQFIPPPHPHWSPYITSLRLWVCF